MRRARVSASRGICVAGRELPGEIQAAVLKFCWFHELAALRYLSRGWKAAAEVALHRLEELVLEVEEDLPVAARYCRRLRILGFFDPMNYALSAALVERNHATLTSLDWDGERVPTAAISSCRALRKLNVDRMETAELEQLVAGCRLLEDVSGFLHDPAPLLTAGLPLRRLSFMAGVLRPRDYAALLSNFLLEEVTFMIDEAAEEDGGLQDRAGQREQLFRGLSGLPRLTALDLQFGPEDAQRSQEAQGTPTLHFPALHTLSLSRDLHWVPDAFTTLSLFSQLPRFAAASLTDLKLEGFSAPGSALRACLPSLTALQMDGYDFADDEGAAAAQAQIVPSGPCPGEAEKGWKGLRSLRLLVDLPYLSGVTRYLTHRPIPSLRELSIRTLFVRPADVRRLLEAVPQLEELSIGAEWQSDESDNEQGSGEEEEKFPPFTHRALRCLALQGCTEQPDPVEEMLRGFATLALPSLQKLTLLSLGEALDLAPLLRKCSATIVALAVLACPEVFVGEPVDLPALTNLELQKAPSVDPAMIRCPQPTDDERDGSVFYDSWVVDAMRFFIRVVPVQPAQ